MAEERLYPRGELKSDDELKRCYIDPDLAPMYQDRVGVAPEDQEEARIQKLIDNPKSLKERENMSANFAKLRQRLDALTVEQRQQSFPVLLREIVLQIKQEEIDAVLDESERAVQQNSFDFLKTKSGGLISHLSETKQASSNMVEAMLQTNSAAIAEFEASDKSGTPPRKFEEFMSHRQSELLRLVVAETHDLLKFMGNPPGHIDSDHEHMLQFIIEKYAVGMRVDGLGSATGDDEDASLVTSEDAKYIGGVIGFHEDIWREKVFAEKVDTALHGETSSVEGQIDRTIGLFHIIDLFGNSLSLNQGDGGLPRLDITTENEKAFVDRFIDLFRRHINMPVGEDFDPRDPLTKEKNWTRGKVTRPEWGPQAVEAITAVFTSLEEGSLLAVDNKIFAYVIEGVKMVLAEAAMDGAMEVQALKAKGELIRGKKVLDVEEKNRRASEIEQVVVRLMEALEKLNHDFSSRIGELPIDSKVSKTRLVQASILRQPDSE